MEKKYHRYLILIKEKDIKAPKNEARPIEISHNDSNNEIDLSLSHGGFLKPSDADIIFPGHIKSYYASAEF